MPRIACLLLPVLAASLWAEPVHGRICADAVVFEDGDGDGVRSADEPGLADIRVSDGSDIVATDARGRFQLPDDAAGPRTVFVIKPAGYAFARRDDGLPDFWRNLVTAPAPVLGYGGMRASGACADIGLRREELPRARSEGLQVLVFADPQPKSRIDVDYYARDIIESVSGDHDVAMPASQDRAVRAADMGLTLGDIVHDDLSLYPDINRATARLGVPWLHVPGNHDLDFDAARDEDSLLTFRHHYGPDTLAWEEQEANFVLLDDVIYQPGRQPAYIGGLREDQFAFLERYLAGADRERLLVVGMHIPLFEAEGRDTFRDADRARLFALLAAFPKVLLLSGHGHTQQHVLHGAATGWRGARPLHEYNVGAACGAYWSGVKDAQGIPDSTMADGTPNGYARLQVDANGGYRLSWHSARGQGDSHIGLHAPRVLRRGAYPAFAMYANIYMARDDTRVEYRIDDGAWTPMQKTLRPDPRLQAENARDDAAGALRGYDRSPEAAPSPHLWRGTLPTGLAPGEHRIEVRAFDAWQGEQRMTTRYRLEEALP